AHLPHRPDVGPVVDAVGRQRVIVAVARHERHPGSLYLAHPDAGGRRPVGGVDGQLLYLVEEAVEARTPEDSDYVPGGVHSFDLAFSRSSASGSGGGGASPCWVSCT